MAYMTYKLDKSRIAQDGQYTYEDIQNSLKSAAEKFRLQYVSENKISDNGVVNDIAGVGSLVLTLARRTPWFSNYATELNFYSNENDCEDAMALIGK